MDYSPGFGFNFLNFSAIIYIDKGGFENGIFWVGNDRNFFCFLLNRGKKTRNPDNFLWTLGLIFSVLNLFVRAILFNIRV